MDHRPELYLHEAMAQILSQCDDRTAEQVYVANEINQQRLYWQLNGGPVRSSQIAFRAYKYPHMFEKIPADPSHGQKAKVRLR